MTGWSEEVRDRKVKEDQPLTGTRLGLGSVLVSQGWGSAWGGTEARSYRPSESPRRGGYGIGILHRGYRGLRLMGGLQNKAGGVGVQCVLGI